MCLWLFPVNTVSVVQSPSEVFDCCLRNSPAFTFSWMWQLLYFLLSAADALDYYYCPRGACFSMLGSLLFLKSFYLVFSNFCDSVWWILMHLCQWVQLTRNSPCTIGLVLTSIKANCTLMGDQIRSLPSSISLKCEAPQSGWRTGC